MCEIVFKNVKERESKTIVYVSLYQIYIILTKLLYTIGFIDIITLSCRLVRLQLHDLMIKTKGKPRERVRRKIEWSY